MPRANTTTMQPEEGSHDEKNLQTEASKEVTRLKIPSSSIQGDLNMVFTKKISLKKEGRHLDKCPQKGYGAQRRHHYWPRNTMLAFSQNLHAPSIAMTSLTTNLDNTRPLSYRRPSAIYRLHSTLVLLLARP